MKYKLIIFFLLLAAHGAFAQPLQKKKPLPAGSVCVDDKGIMRWKKDGREIQGFGVNYTTPFAHAFRSAGKLGVNPLRAIDQDIAQFTRLGFDLFRVHVWDTEISDTLGNLIYNEHLHAFDYLLKQLSDRGINYVLTPIAFWGNGWPEPDENTPGFSRKYGKEACLTHPEAIKAQERYLKQFMEHVNPYTGIAYKDDPRLIAIEISNEPHHQGTPAEVTAYIRRMVEAVRASGFANPVFYNVSHSIHLAASYFQTGIQGGTFQWYPTGLGYQKELALNVLPHVDRYPIPFDSVLQRNKSARIVYEFDAADVGRSYVYPAMARSFREAGIQLATHFSYDPTFLAYANTEYNTHYMNLAYTPSKALSLMISAEVFRRIPLYQNFGRYPENSRFGDFSVSYTDDLALLNASELYYHTNHTAVAPVSEPSLKRIAGYGNSPVVRYDGSGAYFLDKIEEGLWRLEVMPDALIVENPYGRNSLQKTVAVIQWNERKMTLSLKDLGNDFRVEPLRTGNASPPPVASGEFRITPGVYLLARAGVALPAQLPEKIGSIPLREYNGAPPTANRTYVVHSPVEKATALKPLKISAEVLTQQPNPRVRLMKMGQGTTQWVELEHRHGFLYEGELPAEWMEPGLLNYYLIVENKGKPETFPAGKAGLPDQWDFTSRSTYTIRVFDPSQPVVLFGARSDWNQLSFTRWLPSLKPVPLGPPHEAEFQIKLEQLSDFRQTNPDGSAGYNYTVHQYLRHQIEYLRGSLSGKKSLVILARSLTENPVPVQISLISPDGDAFGASVWISPAMQEYEIPLDRLEPVPYVLMPRPYPTFLPYFFFPGRNTSFQLEHAEGLQLSLGAGLSASEKDKPIGVAVSRIWVK